MASTKTNCRICNAQILQTTADQTDGRCMPCWKNPNRFERQQKAASEYKKHREALRKNKILSREISGEPSDDPYTIVSQFTSLLYFDGLDQVGVDDILEVLHSLKEVKAPKCEKALHDLLDFIEAGCSPEGFYDPELVERFLIERDGLQAFEDRYQAANEEEDPKKQFEEKFSD